MPLADRIRTIRERLRGTTLVNEASVSIGVVLPILDALGWPAFDPAIVAPEYSVGTRRVDFALLTHGRPAVFVEVKQPGLAGHADRQLFEYAFHEGVPIAILTDGATWHVYLPAMQGSYDDRRVYLLDLLERDPDDSAERLRRYLARDAVESGEAFERARTDYNRSRQRKGAEAAIPQAWANLASEPRLADLLAAEVESVCGFQPDTADVAAFLVSLRLGENSLPPPRQTTRMISPVPEPSPPTLLPSLGFELEGTFFPGKNSVGVAVDVFRALAARDAGFLNRFVSLSKHGKTRRYVAQDPLLLYPERPDLAHSSAEIIPGYWLATNNSSHRKVGILRMAADVAGVNWGSDLKVRLS